MSTERSTAAPTADLASLCMAITEHAPLPMATVEGATNIVRYVNAAFCDVMDEPAAHLVGKGLHELLPDQDDCVTMAARVFTRGGQKVIRNRKTPTLILCSGPIPFGR